MSCSMRSARRIRENQLPELDRWYSSAETLPIATAANAAVVGLSGKRSPCVITWGIVAAGAYAGPMSVAGEPLADIHPVADPAPCKAQLRLRLPSSSRTPKPRYRTTKVVIVEVSMMKLRPCTELK